MFNICTAFLHCLDTNKTHHTKKIRILKRINVSILKMDNVLLNNTIETCVTSLVILLAAVTDKVLFEYVVLFGFFTFASRRRLEISKGDTSGGI